MRWRSRWGWERTRVVRADGWLRKGVGKLIVLEPRIRPLEAKKAGVPLIVIGEPLSMRVFLSRTNMDGAG